MTTTIRTTKRPPDAAGILPSQEIAKLIRTGAIASPVPIPSGQIQPASLDLRLGPVAHRVRASFLPGKSSVMQKVKDLGMHEISLVDGAVLERGCVYIVPLLERVKMGNLSGAANPKSSTGRLDVFTRLITDNAVEFDRVPAGYEGPLFAEISPRTFSVLAHQGDRLSQLRFRRGAGESGRVAAADVPKDLAISVDLKGSGANALLGYRAKHHADLIDLSRIGHYDPKEYWEPIYAVNRSRSLILNPDDFYILASGELVSVPPTQAAELVAYDPLVGEFRVHYAGFFDPGFGYREHGKSGTTAVLEVRSHDVPFVLEHGQVVGRLVYEPLSAVPDRLYGEAIGSSYARQGLALSKHFKKA